MPYCSASNHYWKNHICVATFVGTLFATVKVILLFGFRANPGDVSSLGFAFFWMRADQRH
jgi:hypothetical protein